MLKQLLNTIYKFKTDFEQLFFHNEYNVLAGEKQNRLKTLGVMLLFTLLGLGFYVGGSHYLKERMDNPFTNWVDVTIRNPSDEALIERVANFYGMSGKLDSLQLEKVHSYVVFPQFFWGKEERLLNFQGRSVDFQKEEIFKKILASNENNVLAGLKIHPDSTVKNLPSNGIVVKKEVIQALYPNVALDKQTKLRLRVVDSIAVFVDVIAVVNELPNNCSFICPPSLYQLLVKSFSETNFLDITSSRNTASFIGTESDSNKVRQWLTALNSPMVIEQLQSEPFDYNENTCYKWNLRFKTYYPFTQRNGYMMQLTQKNPDLDLTPYYDWNKDYKGEALKQPYYFAFQFKRLDQVRAFSQDIKKRFGLDVNMAQVESKENFALVTKLTNLLSFLLLGFSLSTIVLYISSLLRTHLEQVKPNLGTFMAFGLNNSFLIKSYIRIIISFLAIAFLGAFGCCLLLFWGLKALGQAQFFDVLNWQILLAMLVLIGISLWRTNVILQTILQHTPGDLIYMRTDQQATYKVQATNIRASIEHGWTTLWSKIRSFVTAPMANKRSLLAALALVLVGVIGWNWKKIAQFTQPNPEETVKEAMKTIDAPTPTDAPLMSIIDAEAIAKKEQERLERLKLSTHFGKDTAQVLKEYTEIIENYIQQPTEENNAKILNFKLMKNKKGKVIEDALFNEYAVAKKFRKAFSLIEKKYNTAKTDAASKKGPVNVNIPKSDE